MATKTQNTEKRNNKIKTHLNLMVDFTHIILIINLILPFVRSRYELFIYGNKYWMNSLLKTKVRVGYNTYTVECRHKNMNILNFLKTQIHHLHSFSISEIRTLLVIYVNTHTQSVSVRFLTIDKMYSDPFCAILLAEFTFRYDML